MTTNNDSRTPSNSQANALDRFEAQTTRQLWQRYSLLWVNDGHVERQARDCTSATWAAQMFLRTHRGDLPCDVVVTLHGQALVVISQTRGQRPSITNILGNRAVIAAIPNHEYQQYLATAEARALGRTVDAQGWEVIEEGTDADALPPVDADPAAQLDPALVAAASVPVTPTRKPRKSRARSIEAQAASLPSPLLDAYGNPIEG